MLYGLGAAVFALGVMAADSDNLIIPLVMVIAGIVMIRAAGRKDGAK